MQILSRVARRVPWRCAPLLAAGSAVLFWAGCGKSPDAAAPPPAAVAATEPAAKTPGTAAELQKIVGRWLRPDGGYVLEIQSVAPDGKLAATYLNPKSIHIAQAEARKEAGAIKVFVELRDENYPGCTYTLTYDPEHDVMAGRYFQALMKENFEVGFERIKPGQP